MQIRLVRAIVLTICTLLFMLVFCGCQPQPQTETQLDEQLREEVAIEEEKEAEEAVVSEPEAETVQKPTVDFSSLKSEFEAKIAKAANASTVAVTFQAVGDISGGFNINGDKPMIAASMIKMAVLSDVFEKIKNGAHSLDETLTVQPVDVVGGAGTGIKSGQTLTIRELANRMISQSDNTASNTLVSLLGIDDINKHVKENGYENILLDHKFMSTNYKQDNLVSTNDLTAIFEKIANGELGSSEMSKMADGFLLAQTDGLGLQQGASSGFKLGHKTGSLDNVRNDGGIFYNTSGQPAFILVVLTNNINANTANNLMKDLASLACAKMASL